jgi:hypothetical protein
MNNAFEKLKPFLLAAVILFVCHNFAQAGSDCPEAKRIRKEAAYERDQLMQFYKQKFDELEESYLRTKEIIKADDKSRRDAINADYTPKIAETIKNRDLETGNLLRDAKKQAHACRRTIHSRKFMEGSDSYDAAQDALIWQRRLDEWSIRLASGLGQMWAHAKCKSGVEETRPRKDNYRQRSPAGTARKAFAAANAILRSRALRSSARFVVSTAKFLAPRALVFAAHPLVSVPMGVGALVLSVRKRQIEKLTSQGEPHELASTRVMDPSASIMLLPGLNFAEVCAD